MARKNVKYWMLSAALLMPLLAGGVPGSFAQEPEPAAKPSDAPQGKAKPAKKGESASKNSPDQPVWDPLRAEKDLEVGQYYMRKGDVDAAIDRFQDAITAKPGFAIPFRYLGEAQEKKKLREQAIRSYSRYLELVPHADDAGKVRKRIEKLQGELEKEKS
jgi:tetratricopeptide (TPR) repeat protein